MSSTIHERRDALPSGTVLRDFTIQAVIGHGGFGIVYRAGHNELDLTVAIKEYLPVELAVRDGVTVQPRSETDRRDFEDGLRRFRDEAQALIDFGSHPSIVACRDFFRAHGTAYLVMAYEDGQSLSELLAKREGEARPFTESDLLAVMTPLLEGLARVHAAGVLHRDIKPSNILIRHRDERPVLIDFGAAKRATARFSKSQAPYTEGYAALEQVAETGKLGPWTDMYGAGAVMWRMVAGGNRPWEPPHPVRVELRSHAALGETEDPMPSASELGKGRFPPQVLDVVDQCLQLRENKRVQGSRELLEALRVASDGSPAVESVKTALLEANRPDRKSTAASEGPEQRAGWQQVGWLALASMVVGLGLVLALGWDPGSAGSVQDQGPAGNVPALERVDVLDSASSLDQRSPNRESSLESKGTVRAPDPLRDDSGAKAEDSEPEVGRGSVDGFDLRPQSPQNDMAQPWVRDWDALGDINGPDFVATAREYIEEYKQVPEASMLVAQAEELMAKLSELESASPKWREAGESLVAESSRSLRPPYRNSRPDAEGPVRDPSPTGGVSDRTQEDVEAEIGPASDYTLDMHRQAPQADVVKPWVRDWDALGDINGPDFVATARAYLEEYKQVSEASVWVARVEGLLDKLRESESAKRSPRNAGESWTNSLGMEFAWIPAGSFIMGSPVDAEDRDSDERQHEVQISEGFWMKAVAVTEEEWAAVMGRSRSNSKDCGPRCPVTEVSPYDAHQYIQSLNGRESGRGYHYRLPTEAEWEYAARAGTTGSRYGELNEVAWLRTNSNQMHPVGQKQANAWGLHDMLGNVWEWTTDLYGRYSAGPVKDPSGPPSRWAMIGWWSGAGVARGGAWNSKARQVRFANRKPAYWGRYGNIGFRLVRTK